MPGENLSLVGFICPDDWVGTRHQSRHSCQGLIAEPNLSEVNPLTQSISVTMPACHALTLSR